MGIMVGGLSTLAPHKRDVLSREVPRALVAGTLAAFATACVAAAIYSEDDVSVGLPSRTHPVGSNSTDGLG
jgi:hypothetical protein